MELIILDLIKESQKNGLGATLIEEEEEPATSSFISQQFSPLTSSFTSSLTSAQKSPQKSQKTTPKM